MKSKEIMIDFESMMYVFAGNNGSGKSTIRNLIVDRLGISVNIDPDALARRINPIHPEKYRFSAGKDAIRLAKECIAKRRDFSIETTLAGGNAIRLIKEAKRNGFEITMFYIGLGDPYLNIERVAARVRNGGHDIPTEDIIKRHTTSMENLLRNIELVDNLVVIDNSSLDGVIVLESSGHEIKYLSSICPAWVWPVKEVITKE
jgi:predicted ABC-type ATPase